MRVFKNQAGISGADCNGWGLAPSPRFLSSRFLVNLYFKIKVDAIVPAWKRYLVFDERAVVPGEFIR